MRNSRTQEADLTSCVCLQPVDVQASFLGCYRTSNKTGSLWQNKGHRVRVVSEPILVLPRYQIVPLNQRRAGNRSVFLSLTPHVPLCLLWIT